MGKGAVSPEPENLRRSLEETSRALEAAQAGFDQTSDKDLLEYYLFEIHALRARHTYLLRRLKARASPAPPSAG